MRQWCQTSHQPTAQQTLHLLRPHPHPLHEYLARPRINHILLSVLLLLNFQTRISRTPLLKLSHL